ncbi:MAG: uracil-DNA glycosylase [Cyclobacteriaceae bacterium]|nr:uracil-DNA glycosylase [Cyclobacteriaceae bacterium]MCH8515930.1 uracil-DNA glycosylase [Cyclobacteriaceae bacterium]
MTKTKIRIGGVPEHFNYPIHQAIEEGAFEAQGIEVRWMEYSGGTGEMKQALNDNACDLCIILTEGILADIAMGSASKIIGGYVSSPLIWGLHVGAKSMITEHSQVYQSKIAISRKGSGSHLMPMIDALMNDQTIADNQFQIVGNLKGAIEKMSEHPDQVFYWEKYTTQPYVDQGVFNRIGEFPTPWPCFVIAASSQAQQDAKRLQSVLDVIYEYTSRFHPNLKNIESVAKNYKLDAKEVKAWFERTTWYIDRNLKEEMIHDVLGYLAKAGIIHSNYSKSISSYLLKV